MQRMEDRGQDVALFSMDHGSSPAFAGRSLSGISGISDFKDPDVGFLKKVKMAAHAYRSAVSPARDAQMLG